MTDVEPITNFTNAATAESQGLSVQAELLAEAKTQNDYSAQAKKDADKANELSDQSNKRDKQNRLAEFDIQARQSRRSVYGAVAATGGIAMQGIAASVPQVSQQSVKQLSMVIAVAGKIVGIIDATRNYTDVLGKQNQLLNGDKPPSDPNANTNAALGTEESRADAPRTGPSSESAGIRIAAAAPLAPAA